METTVGHPGGATTPLTPAGRPSRSTVHRAAIAGLIGTTLETYDFVIYGTASALVFNKLFFSNVSPAAGILASFATYAIGFGARPLGGLIFSHFGERLGRKWVLVSTLLFMGVSTFAIGALPTFAAAGLWSPALLVLCRFVQGIGAGAEQAGGIVLLTETADRDRRGRVSSLVYVGAAAGTALGALAWMGIQLLPKAYVQSWGWRLVFFSSIVVTIAALIIRSKLAESPVFQELKAAQIGAKAPIVEVLKDGRPTFLRVFFMMFGVSVQSYTYQVFMGSYLITVIKAPPALVPKVLLVGALFACVSAYVAGAASDRFGRRPIYLWITGLLVLLPVPSFLLLDTGSTVAIYVVIVLGFVLAVQGAVGVQSSYFPELFGVRHRYAGVALGREIASPFGGGLAPLICSALLAAFANSWWPVAIYMMVTMATSFLAAWMSPETRGRDLLAVEDATRS